MAACPLMGRPPFFAQKWRNNESFRNCKIRRRLPGGGGAVQMCIRDRIYGFDIEKARK